MRASDGDTPNGESPEETLTIVLADDEPDVLLLMKMQIEREPGFEVVGEATSGDETLRLVNELDPDLLLLDLAMPKTDGIVVIEKMKARGSRTKIVVYSNAGRAMVAEAMGRGADAYLEKTGSIFDVVTILRDVMRRD